MKLKHIVLLMTLTLLVTGAFAQQSGLKSALGIHFGTTTGSGYAMRWMGEKHGLQLTLGAYTFGDGEANFPEVYEDRWYYPSEVWAPVDTLITIDRVGREAAANIGLNHIYTLDKFKNGRLYLMSGASYKLFRQNVFSQDYVWETVEVDSSYSYGYYKPYGDETEKIVTQHRWTVGIGPGFEIDLGKQFKVAFELPISYNWKNDIVMWIPQLGVYYYFK